MSATRSPSHPMTNPAIAVELTMREREALMTVEDWSEQVDILLAVPAASTYEEGPNG